MEFEILSTNLLDQYKLVVADDALAEAFNRLHDAELSTDDFSFYTSVASVYSSKIEGENIDLDSFIKYKRFGIEFEPDYTRKIDDLYLAYQFAKENRPGKENIAKAHAMLAKRIVQKSWQGKLRNGNMFVTTPDGKIEYVAASPFEVTAGMDKLHRDIDKLLQQDLKIAAAFYFASLIHLVFVKIHPWNDGNGRSARLLEKWFLAEKLGPKSWFIQSEKYYYLHHQTYYQHIRKLGIEYQDLDYSHALPFLQLLPAAITER